MEFTQEQIDKFNEYVSKYQFLDSLENLHLNFGPVQSPGDHPLEQVYMHNIFKELVNWEYFSEYQFYILSTNQPYDYSFDDKSIVFCMSNEDHHIPEDMLKAGLIFSPYSPINHKHDNCYPIPLGYNGSLVDLPIKSMKERKYDVFFSGNVHRKRVPFFFSSKIHQIIQSVFKPGRNKSQKFQFHRKFTGGLNPRQYSETLMNTKIALVPEGYLSDISFRFFEAAKFGCIIITRDLYDFWYFKGFPGIELNTWFKLNSTLGRLLSDPDKMDQIHSEMLKYYNEKCSETATSTYIIEKLNDLRSNK